MLTLTKTGVNKVEAYINAIDAPQSLDGWLECVLSSAAGYGEAEVLEHGYSYETGRKSSQGYNDFIEFDSSDFEIIN